MSKNQTTEATPDIEAPTLDALAEQKKPESVLWKVAGGLAAGLGLAVVIAVFFHIRGQLTSLRNEVATSSKEMRGELARLAQSQGGLVKKDEVTTRMRNVWDRLKELQTSRTDLTTLRERCTLLGELYKAGEAERKTLADQVRRMREKSRAVEEKAELARQVRQMRERIATLEARPAGGAAEQSDKP